MAKSRGVDKKSRSRNLKGLSIFDDEIAAPADYGDFMKIDAPVSLRSATIETNSSHEVAPTPHWEKFIGTDEPESVLVAKVEPTQVEEVQTLVTSIVVQDKTLTVEIEEAIQPTTQLKEEQNASSMQLLEVVTEKLEILQRHQLKDEVKTAHKLPTAETHVEIIPAPKVVPPKTIQPRIQLKSSGYEKITPSYGFGSLVGVQRRIVLFIFEDCVRSGKSETTPLTTEHICQTLTLTYKTARGSIWRLQEKRFLEVAASKEGRGGWVIYRLNREIYSELLLMKNSNQLLDRDIGIGQIRAETLEPNISRHEPTAPDTLADEWDSIDFSGLESFGFSKYHLRQLATQKENKLTPKEVQDSINFFIFDLNKNNKRNEIGSNPVNFFMGIVRKGTPYSPPTNYISPEEERRIKYLSSLKAREEARVQQEEEIKALAFKDWFHGLSEAEKANLKSIAPKHAQERGPAQQIFVQEYFDKNIWPNIFSNFSNNSEERSKIESQVRESLNQ